MLPFQNSMIKYNPNLSANSVMNSAIIARVNDVWHRAMDVQIIVNHLSQSFAMKWVLQGNNPAHSSVLLISTFLLCHWKLIVCSATIKSQVPTGIVATMPISNCSLMQKLCNCAAYPCNAPFSCYRVSKKFPISWIEAQRPFQSECNIDSQQSSKNHILACVHWFHQHKESHAPSECKQHLQPMM